MNSGVQLWNYSLKLVKRVIFRTPGFLDWLKTFLLDLFRKLPKLTKRYFAKVMLLKKNILIIFLLLLRICKTGAVQLQKLRTNRIQDPPKLNFTQAETFRKPTSSTIEPKPLEPLGYKDIPDQAEQSKLSGKKALQTQDFHLTEITKNPQKFPIKSKISWIQDITKFKDKIFSKHLFKPHLDPSNNSQINYIYPQQLNINKDTNPEGRNEDQISISSSNKITNLKTLSQPTSNQSTTPSLPLFATLEDTIDIPPVPVPPDITQTDWDSINWLEDENNKDRKNLYGSLNHHSEVDMKIKYYSILLYSLQKIFSLFFLYFKPDSSHLNQNLRLPQILVGVG
jgi:hypothetical protein